MIKLLLFIPILIILAPAIAGLSIRKVIQPINVQSEKTVIIDQSHPFSQTFTSTNKNLSGLLLKLKNRQIKNHDPLTFELSHMGQVIRRLDLSGTNIPEPDWIRLSFTPLPDSANQSYQFTLRTTTQSTESAIDIETNKQDQALLKTIHSINSYPELISGIYTHWFNKLTQNPHFSIVYLGIIVGLVVLIFWPTQTSDQKK